MAEPHPIVRALGALTEHVEQMASRTGKVEVHNVEHDDANIKKFLSRFTLLMAAYPDRPDAPGGQPESPMLKHMLIELEVPVAVNPSTYEAVVDVFPQTTLVYNIPHINIPNVNLANLDIPSVHRAHLATERGNLKNGPIVIDLRIPTSPFNVSITVSLDENNTVKVDVNAGQASFAL